MDPLQYPQPAGLGRLSDNPKQATQLQRHTPTYEDSSKAEIPCPDGGRLVGEFGANGQCS